MRDVLIVVGAVGGAIALIVAVGMLVDAIPAIVAAVAGWIAFAVLLMAIAAREL